MIYLSSFSFNPLNKPLKFINLSLFLFQLSGLIMNKHSVIFVLIFTFFISIPSLSQKPELKKDAFQQIMSILNIDESNLGFRPKGYWTRYPDPKDIPYKMLSFDDLFAEPQRIYDFVKNMAVSVEDYLHPDYLAANHNSIMKLAYYCGFRNVTSQFREYSASLFAEIDEKEPLLVAIKDIYTKTNTVWKYNAMGKASDFPLIEKDLRNAIKSIDIELQKVIARTVIHLTEAYRFRQIGMRNVDFQKANDVWRIRNLGETQFDGLEYFPQIEDCAKEIDMNSIYYAGMKIMESGLQLADTLKILKKKLNIDWKNQNLNIVTPIGRIVISGTKDDVHEYNDLLLLVDLGGDDVYKGPIGSTPSLNIPISLAIDLEGDDKYINKDEFVPSQGAAIFGAAMLLDMEGNDVYESKRFAQGSGMFGIGILADMEGDDKYDMWTIGQGAGFFGVGVAIDNNGDDSYRIYGDGQGYGGVAGVGTLINRTGNDSYYSEPLASVVFRPDYHSKDGKINYSYSQGCGIGRRGDVTDGHSWAGGIGTLIDISGNDTYKSGNWSLGCGYWYGMGFIYDGSGDDKYLSASWSQAAGAHFCIGGLIDEGGNDTHTLWEEQSVGCGFGHDFTVALFLDKGGNDVYKVKDDGLGFAINKSQVFFIDTEGDDTYITSGKGHNYGWNNFDVHNPPFEEFFYHLFADQVCIFTDIKGNDKYLTKEYPDGKEESDKRMADGIKLLTPENKDTLASKRYYGIGMDFKDFTGPEIEYFRDKLKRRNK